MYNNFSYNTRLYNQARIVDDLQGDGVRINGYSLEENGLKISEFDPANSASVQIITADIPRGDGATFLRQRFQRRVFTIRGYITLETPELVQAKINEFKRELKAKNMILKYDFAGTKLNAVVNWVNSNDTFTYPRRFNFCEFTIELESTNPITSYEPNYEFRSNIDQTVTTLNDEVSIGGTEKTKPILFVSFASATNVTGITFKNNTRNETISVTGLTVSAGDTIIIDHEKNEVKYNGSIVNYDGDFVFLDTLENSYTIEIEGLSPTVQFNSTLRWRNNYI
jgi:hypothetical protein